MASVYLSLGTNLGDRAANLRAALAELAALGTLTACSSVYETEPWGDPRQPRFLNLCCALATSLGAEQLHAATKAIEQRLGRRPGRPWGPRLIDIDLLTYDELRLRTPRLTLPHPRIADRAFVLAPLAEIAPQARVPGLGGTARELLAAIPGADAAARAVAPAAAVLPPSA